MGLGELIEMDGFVLIAMPILNVLSRLIAVEDTRVQKHGSIAHSHAVQRRL